MVLLLLYIHSAANSKSLAFLLLARSLSLTIMWPEGGWVKGRGEG